MHYVAVHGGAGFHSRENENVVKRALVNACKQGLASLQNGEPALTAAERTICVLEDDACLNAGTLEFTVRKLLGALMFQDFSLWNVLGFGSNLTLTGKVECDAAIMDACTGDFGSVGSASGMKNPIRLARALLEGSRVPDPLGRIPPMTLVGDGAFTWAETHALDPGMTPIVRPDTLISTHARSQWLKWKRRLDEAKSLSVAAQSEFLQEQNAHMDTVGAVALDSVDGMAAGVSSGGILLKHPGRVGEAAIFGAGCWAELQPSGIPAPPGSQIAREPVFGADVVNNVNLNSEKGTKERNAAVDLDDNGEGPGAGVIQEPEKVTRTAGSSNRGMACSVSGAGEHIVRTMLARTIAQALYFDRPETRSQTTPVKSDTIVSPSERAKGTVQPTSSAIAHCTPGHSDVSAVPPDGTSAHRSHHQAHHNRDYDGTQATSLVVENAIHSDSESGVGTELEGDAAASARVASGVGGGAAPATVGSSHGQSPHAARREAAAAPAAAWHARGAAAARGGRIDGSDSDMDLDAPRGDNSEAGSSRSRTSDCDAGMTSADTDEADGDEGDAVDVHEALRRTLVDRFWAHTRARGEPDPSAGVILLTKECRIERSGRNTQIYSDVRLWCAFTTPTMAIAYASSSQTKPKAMILRRPKSVRHDEPSVYITSIAL
ncbi:hypothetical protein HGRIS_002543 [Hohenbuehelia grisea]|uniref:Asparaginase n=1 Tax=Hohenbuehelia grisea TaxID=104357 RepID=A0ABR3JMW7_9AGAR